MGLARCGTVGLCFPCLRWWGGCAGGGVPLGAGPCCPDVGRCLSGVNIIITLHCTQRPYYLLHSPAATRILARESESANFLADCEEQRLNTMYHGWAPPHRPISISIYPYILYCILYPYPYLRYYLFYISLALASSGVGLGCSII